MTEQRNTLRQTVAILEETLSDVYVPTIIESVPVPSALPRKSLGLTVPSALNTLGAPPNQVSEATLAS